MRRKVVGNRKLIDLALGNHGGGFGQNAQNLKRSVLDHQTEGSAQQEVPDQHGRLVAPQRVGRPGAASEGTVIDDIVVKKCRCVDELDARREIDVAFSPIAEHPGGEQGERGTDTLAARRDEASGDLRDQCDRILEELDNDPVDCLEIPGNQVSQAFKGLFGGFTVQACNGQIRLRIRTATTSPDAVRRCRMVSARAGPIKCRREGLSKLKCSCRRCDVRQQWPCLRDGQTAVGYLVAAARARPCACRSGRRTWP